MKKKCAACGNGHASDLEVDALVEMFLGLARQSAIVTLTQVLGNLTPVVASANDEDDDEDDESAADEVAGTRTRRQRLAASGDHTDRIYRLIQENPGIRAEIINKELGLESGVFAKVAKQLLADGRVKTEGNKRATKYFPTDGSFDDAELVE